LNVLSPRTICTNLVKIAHWFWWRFSFGWGCINRGPVSQLVWHDKIPPCSKALSTEHRPKFADLSPVMVTAASLLKNCLCSYKTNIQVWLKLAKWFWNQKCKSLQTDGWRAIRIAYFKLKWAKTLIVESQHRINILLWATWDQI
jgi:hypothetical protein